jgi:beta-galactosidase/beta-glucuronidase
MLNPNHRVADTGNGNRPYPRPQLRRTKWQLLNGVWDFALDREGVFSDWGEVLFDRKIEVPFAPETPASGIGDDSYFVACWYRRKITCESKGSERVLLHFEAVDEQCELWVNGRWMGRREGGYTRQSWDITDAIGTGGEAELILRAYDDPHDLHKPRGKQDWLEHPHRIWYPRTTGIWQSVWLETVSAVRIENLRWSCSLERYEIGLEVSLAGRVSKGSLLRVRLISRGEVLVDDSIGVCGRELSRAFRLPDPGIESARHELLWSPEHPNLIDAEISLEDAAGEILDEVGSYTALRTIEVRDGRYELNGAPYYMRLVLDQGYWPEAGMTAPSDEALAEDIRLSKKMGFNGVRKHQKIEAERFLYWADVLGFVVWEELPSAYAFSTRSLSKLVNVWRAAIERDRNHPSIVAWVPFNESWAVPDLPRDARQRHAVAALYHLTKSLDGSRPANGNDGWEIAETDMVGVHDYEADPEVLRQHFDSTGRGWEAALQSMRFSGRRVLLDGSYRGQPVLLTEFGGIKLAVDGESWGYSTATSSEDLEMRYVRLLSAVRAIPNLAGFCYTQFTDTYQEANGLLTMERQPKFSVDSIRIATRGPIGAEERLLEEKLREFGRNRHSRDERMDGGNSGHPAKAEML